jgi:hypothetical protein
MLLGRGRRPFEELDSLGVGDVRVIVLFGPGGRMRAALIPMLDSIVQALPTMGDLRTRAPGSAMDLRLNCERRCGYAQ